MTAVPPLRLRRVDRWLARRGRGLWPISWDAARLLDDRLRMRRRAEIYGGVFLGLAALAYLLSAWKSQPRPSSANDVAVGWWAVAVGSVAVGSVVRQCVLVRDERRLATSLPPQTSAGVRAGLWHKLGPARSAGLVVAFVSPLALAVLLGLSSTSRTFIAVYTVTLLVALGCAAYSATRVVGAPTVAVDRPSRQIDDRLRIRDLDNAITPMLVLLLSVLTPIGQFDGDSPHSFRFLTFTFAALLTCLLLNSLGQTKMFGPREMTSPS